MTIVPAGWRSVIVRTSVYDHGRSIDFREEVWRGPWPEVEAVVRKKRITDHADEAFVSLSHEGGRWSSILFPSLEGWVCLGEEALRRVRHGTLDVAEAFFSTTFAFTRGSTDRVPPATRAAIETHMERVMRWRAGDVTALLSRRIMRDARVPWPRYPVEST